MSVAITLVALVVHGRVDFRIRYAGERLPGSEVCFYPMDLANPFSVFATAGQVRCLPADKLIEIPPNGFGVYARHPRGLISANHGFITGTTDAQAVKGVSLDLAAAATLDLSVVNKDLATADDVAILEGETAKNRGAVIPVPRGATSILVPADTPLLPVIVHGGKPTRIGSLATVGAGKTLLVRAINNTQYVMTALRPVDPFTGQGLVATTEGGVVCAQLYSQQFLALLGKQAVPDVTLRDGRGRPHAPILAPMYSQNLLNNIFVFDDVPPGDATLLIGGARWLAQQVPVSITPGGLVISDLIPVHVGSALDVTVTDIAGWSQPNRVSCDAVTDPLRANADQAERPNIAVYDCGKYLHSIRLTVDTPKRCTVIQEKRGDWATASSAVTQFAGLTPGAYLVTVSRGSHTAAMDTVETAPGESIRLTMSGRGFYVAGRITRGGKPVVAQLLFRTGSAVSTPSGEYGAYLTASPGKTNIQVKACDHSFEYIHVPESEVAAGAGYDIDVPINKVEVTVTDAVTGSPLPDARAIATVFRDKGDTQGLYMMPGERDSNGRVVVDSLPSGKTTRICAEAANYKSACDTVEILKDVQEVSIALRPAAERHAHVGTGKYSLAYWCLADGTVTEHAAVDENGDIRFHLNHGAPEYTVLVGASPLYVIPAVSADPGGLPTEIAPPGLSATRAIRIAVAPSLKQSTAIIGLVVNGVRIPQSAFAQHQRFRRAPFMLIGRAAVEVYDIYTTDIVDVILGPDPASLPHDFATGTDVFTVPYLVAGLPHLRVGATNEVVFH